jgi:hypothetical protein
MKHLVSRWFDRALLTDQVYLAETNITLSQERVYFGRPLRKNRLSSRRVRLKIEIADSFNNGDQNARYWAINPSKLSVARFANFGLRIFGVAKVSLSCVFHASRAFELMITSYLSSPESLLILRLVRIGTCARGNKYFGPPWFGVVDRE